MVAAPGFSFVRSSRRVFAVLAAPLLLSWSDPALHVRVSHVLAPGTEVSRWVLEPGSQRVAYAVGRAQGQPSQFFSASSDGSGDVLTLTDPIPENRTISSWDYSRGRIAYICDLEVDERSELYSVRTDVSQAPVKLNDPLLDPFERVLSARYTPDGSRVLFVTGSTFSGRTTLYSVPSDGSQPAVALQVPEPDVWGIDLVEATSDSRRALYVSRPALLSANYRLHSVLVDGSAAPVVITPSARSENPSGGFLLSPDGKWVVFYSPTRNGGDIYSAMVDGNSPPRPLFFPRESGSLFAHQITPDSSRVAALSSGFEGFLFAPVDGSARPEVLSDPENVIRNKYRIMDDGRVVFWETQRAGLYVQPIDGGEKALRILGERGDPLPFTLEVGPEGDVVFMGTQAGRQGLYSVPADGSRPFVRLSSLSGSVAIYDEDWFSTDGSYLLYVDGTEAGGVPELHAVRPDGKTPSRKVSGLLPPDGRIRSHGFAPDSRRVFYATTGTDGGLFTSVISDEETVTNKSPLPGALR